MALCTDEDMAKKKKKSQVTATDRISVGGNCEVEVPKVKKQQAEAPSVGTVLTQAQPPTLVICRNKYVVNKLGLLVVQHECVVE